MFHAQRLVVRRAMCTWPAPSSFIMRAAAASDPEALIGPFRSAGVFDSCVDGMMVDAIGPDGVRCRLPVTRARANNFGTLHGGCIATLVDVVGTLALLGQHPSRPGVSVEMNQSFLAAAKVDEILNVEGRVLRYGRKLGFTEVTIRAVAGDMESTATLGSEEGRLVAVGRHTKYMEVKVRAPDR